MMPINRSPVSTWSKLLTDSRSSKGTQQQWIAFNADKREYELTPNRREKLPLQAICAISKEILNRTIEKDSATAADGEDQLQQRHQIRNLTLEIVENKRKKLFAPGYVALRVFAHLLCFLGVITIPLSIYYIYRERQFVKNLKQTESDLIWGRSARQLTCNLQQINIKKETTDLQNALKNDIQQAKPLSEQPHRNFDFNLLAPQLNNLFVGQFLADVDRGYSFTLDGKPPAKDMDKLSPTKQLFAMADTLERSLLEPKWRLLLQAVTSQTIPNSLIAPYILCLASGYDNNGWRADLPTYLAQAGAAANISNSKPAIPIALERDDNGNILGIRVEYKTELYPSAATTQKVQFPFAHRAAIAFKATFDDGENLQISDLTLNFELIEPDRPNMI